VSRTTGFQTTRYEHFLASATALSPNLERAAELGNAVVSGGTKTHDIGLGQIIKDCVKDVNAWQHGGNTLLGSIIMLSPIAVAAGMTSVKEGAFEIRDIRKNVDLIVKSTTSEDAVNVYEAICMAKPGGLGRTSELDVNDPNSIRRIREEKIPLYRIFQISAKHDTICSEWVNNYPLTFDVAYASLIGSIRRNGDLNRAIVHAFLKVLSACPDTLIARKAGIEKAKEISLMANELLRAGGLETTSGREPLADFDSKLRQTDNLLNPGTTADIIASALALCVLGGYRP
jgi:triphosphoribosyl-dephospho-CoA synthase